ncbi:hypothetical protein [Oceanobacter mangrovi]|uniref:hypothetical protein n=1 Tax=Oceanobacter mangrovi TaxID=2862510 RepID=UPI001C8DF64A|nr:hypothetical protein [Oceanobacter mangrovi]
MKQNNKNNKSENQAISSFESFFYRFIAWFPILMLPSLVWEMISSGDYAVGGLIGVMHAVLVFRFVTIANQQQWFKRKKAAG